VDASARIHRLAGDYAGTGLETAFRQIFEGGGKKMVELAMVIKVIFIVTAVIYVIEGLLKAIHNRIGRIGSIILCLFGAWLLLFACGVSPLKHSGSTYILIGKTNKGTVVIDKLCKEGNLAGKPIAVEKARVCYTENPKLIGKYKWGFGWIEYKNKVEIIREVIAETDEKIYFVNKNGKPDTMVKKKKK